jgi:hypothetical protein
MQQLFESTFDETSWQTTLIQVSTVSIKSSVRSRLTVATPFLLHKCRATNPNNETGRVMFLSLL